MTKERSEAPNAHTSIPRTVHRSLSRLFSKLRGIPGGSIIAVWLFGGMLLALSERLFSRILGIIVLLLFIATYLFLAYCYPDEKA